MRRILTKKSQRAMARSGTAICPICFERHLLVLHHIFGREVTGWNKPWNEVLLCSNCHFDVHHGNLIIKGWVMTTEGRVLQWHRVKIVPDSGEVYVI